MTQGDNFLDDISQSSRPKPNILGDFDCVECRKPVYEAYYSRQEKMLKYWCEDDHESVIKEIEL